MTSLIRSILLRQELHISQDLKERIFIGPQQGKIKILTRHLPQSWSCNLSLHLCAFQRISCSFKRFHWYLSGCFQAVRPRIFPRLLTKNKSTPWQRYDLVRSCLEFVIFYFYSSYLTYTYTFRNYSCRIFASAGWRVVAFLKQNIENQ